MTNTMFSSKIMKHGDHHLYDDLDKNKDLGDSLGFAKNGDDGFN